VCGGWGANTPLGKGYSTHLKKKRDKNVPSKLGRGKEMYLCQEYLPLLHTLSDFTYQYPTHYQYPRMFIPYSSVAYS